MHTHARACLQNVRIEAGSATMPVLDGQDRTRIFDVIGDNLSCNDASDCSSCTSPSICEGADCKRYICWENKCLVTYGDTASTGVSKEEGPHSCCDNVANLKLGSTCTSSKGQGLLNERAFVHMYGAYCWGGYLMEYCKAREDGAYSSSPPAASSSGRRLSTARAASVTKLTLGELHLTRGRAEQRDTQHSFQSNGGAIRAIYSEVKLQGTKITHSHAVAEKIAASSSYNSFKARSGGTTGSGGGIFAHESKLTIRDGPSGRRAEISSCTARSTDGLAFGGGVLWTMDAHKNFIKTRLTIARANFADCAAVYGGGLMAGDFTGDSAAHAPTNAFVQDVDFDRCHADLINPNDEDQSEVQGAFYGGAAMIYLQDASDTTFERVNVRDCTSRYIGGGVATFSPTIIIDSAFTGCHTSERSGAASTKVNNAGQAGALWFKDEWGDTWATGRKGGAKLVVNRTQFVNNTAKVAGGCVSMRLGLETSVLADVDFTRCGIINTDSVYAVGGAVAVWGQALDSTAASVHSAVELHNAKIRNSWVVSRRAGQLTNVGGGGIWVWASTNNDGNAGHPQSITLKMYDSLVEDCTTWCEADKGMCYGGAALLWKDDVRGYFHGTTFRHNSAIASGGIVAEGGGLYRVEFGSNGIVQFADGTVFEGNAARTEKRASDSEASDNGNVGHSFKLEGGLSLYALPAPPGRYIYATDCMVKRLSCARNAYFMIDDEDCPLAEPYCEQIADPEYEDGKFLAANLTSGPYAGKQCRPSQGVWQQCNWQRLPSLIGSSVQTLESVAEDEDYPYPCLKGMLGSGDVQDQMSPACKSYCPAGFYCPTNMTVTPIPCQVGHYCAAGTSVPVPCAAGTYSSTGVTEQSECINCPAGSYCASGSTAPTQCGVGTYQSNEQQEACVECDVGKYSSAFGASSCQTCGAGNYSSNVLSCLPCGIGEYCPFGSRGGIKCPIAFTTTAAPGAMQEADCICRMGMYLNATYISQEETTTDGNQTITTASLKLDQTKSACVPCMSPTEKTNCTYEGVTLETLPIRPGYWRSSASSGEIRWCYTQSVCVGGTDPAAYCREGHMGAFCHTCKPEFHKDPTGICQPCEGAWGLSMLRLLGVLILLIGLLVAGFALGSRSKRARKDYTEGQFAKGNTETRAVQSAGAVSGGTRQGSLGLPAIGLPALLGVLRLRFPALAWPELPDVQLGELQLPSFTFPGVRTIALPDVTLPELIVRYPQFPWLTGGKFTLAHLAIILRIVFPDLAWPDLPDVSLPEWDWPEMPPLCFPTLPKLALPHWSSAAVLCGVNFEGFSIKVRILISLFQILCQLGVVYSIPWPPIFSGLLSWMAFINLDLPTLVPLGCFMNVNFYFSLVAQTMLLPVLSIIPLVASCSYFCNKRAAMWLVEQSGNLGFWILFVIYPSVSAKCFAVFGCEKVDDGTAWLRVDLSIQCNDGAHTIMQLYSLIMIIIYPIGTPCFYYLAMRRHRLKLDKLKSNQELRARLVDQTRAERRHVIAEKSQLAAKRVKAPPELSRGASKAWRIDAGTFATMPSDTQQRLAELAREAHDERKALPSHIRKLTKGYEARVWWFEIFECVPRPLTRCQQVPQYLTDCTCALYRTDACASWRLHACPYSSNRAARRGSSSSGSWFALSPRAHTLPSTPLTMSQTTRWPSSVRRRSSSHCFLLLLSRTMRTRSPTRPTLTCSSSCSGSFRSSLPSSSSRLLPRSF